MVVSSGSRHTDMARSRGRSTQLVLPLEGGWPQSCPAAPATTDQRFHPRSLAPRELDDGGCFDYPATPAIFLGRTGFGPLRLAWDTNVLIDWRDFGRTLLEDDEVLPPGLDSRHQEELVALGAVMTTTYTTRDVRILPLWRQRRDLGGSRSPGYRWQQERVYQLDEVASALQCVGLSDELRKGYRPPPASWWRADVMKPSPDRLLVEEAITRGCHVFLTRDRKILGCGSQIRRLGLVVIPPTGLLDAIIRSADMSSPMGADGMVCDSHKLIRLERVARSASTNRHDKAGA